MFFKRIEMIGFKSFATRTVLEFIPGTTVIVGPNGCGKSNILDAIKWVLGEQVASQMRGKRMADVIFAGSASFKALGVAQVTLTLDNSRRLLPIDFEEVQITRRLFRTGESEYLINKTPCRLRDVADLFLGTGIGKSAYSILEQGRVDQIIQARPIERRGLIEEAAGISRFRARKDEALRKLERTDADLARLNDLLIEVERQVASLKRQAARAERYKQCLDEWRRAEQELLVLRARALDAQTADLEARMRELGDRLAAVRARLDVAAAQEEQARDREQALAAQIADDQQALFGYKSALQNCEHQVRALAERIDAGRRRAEQIRGELGELDARAAEFRLRAEEARLRAEEAERAREDATARYEALRARYAELEHSARERAQAVERLSAEVEQRRRTATEIENRLRTAEAMIAGLEESRAQWAAALAPQAAVMEDHDRRRRELEADVARAEAVVAGLEEALAGDRQAQADLQRRLGELLRELEQIERRLHEGRSRLETLAELRAGYEGYYQGVRETLLAADRGELEGLLGAAPSLIRPRPEHELAIEVALATHLQDIVARTAEDARRAIEYLKRFGRGRATFLPLDRLQPAELAPHLRAVLGRPGVIGVASDLVEYDPAIRTAVLYLLGTTILVEDLQVGLQLGGEGYRARYVSLDGQLIHPAGAMTGGRIQATGLLSREREVRELTERVAQWDGERRALRERIEATQAELAAAHDRTAQRQAELEQRRIERANRLKDAEAQQRAQEEAARALEEGRRRLEHVEAEQAAHRAQIDALRPQLEAARAALADAEKALAAEREAAAHQGADILSLGAAVAEARGDMEKARERLAGAQEQLRTIESDLEALARQDAARRRELETIESDDRRLREQIGRVEAEAAASRAEHDALARRLEQTQAEREQAALEARRLGGEIDAARRDERELDNQYRELELRHMELATHRTNLQAQAEEKFDRPLDRLLEAYRDLDKDPHAAQVEAAELREKLDRMGMVNLEALEQYREQAERLEFLRAQHRDLTEARAQLAETIARLNDTTRQLFQETFESVRGHFVAMFRRLFEGGRADLLLEAPDGADPLLEGGIEIVAQPPGKKLQSLTLLSGGEKALTAIALLFALFLHKPTPFCILDEIDAPLDDLNIERFKAIVREFSRQTQFVIITHNKLTMELGDVLHGVTMEESGVSKLVSVRFEQAERLVNAG